eukprot:276035_1
MPAKKKKKKKKKNKQRNRQKKDKPKNRNKGNASLSPTQLLKKGCNELNPDYVSVCLDQMKKKKKKKLTHKTLMDCFNMVWNKCGNKQQCTEHILSKKLILLQTLISDFELDLNYDTEMQNIFVFDRICLLCSKCLLPIIELCIELCTSAAHKSSLKQLILHQLHHTLCGYCDTLATKFETNAFGIVNMSWKNIVKPTLNQWWSSPQNTQCKAVIPWSISHGVYLDVVFPYFSIFAEHIYTMDAHARDGNKEQLCIPELVYNELVLTLGQSLRKRQRECKHHAIYDRDLEYLYMNVADLFDEGRLRWLRTDKGIQVYQSYVNAVNDCTGAKCPLIGKVVTLFLIGNAGMIIK